MTIQSMWMLVATLLFTVTNMLMRLCSAHYGIMEIIFYRSLIGLAFIVFVLWQKKVGLATDHPWLHLRRCAAGILSMASGIYLMQLLPFAMAQTLWYTNPLFFAAFLVVSLKLAGKAIDWNLVVSIAVGFAGALLILRPDFSGTAIWIACVGVFAGFISGVTDWFIRDLTLAGEPRERIIFYFFLVGTVFGALYVSVSPAEAFHTHTAEGVVRLLLMGATATLAQVALVQGWARGAPLVNAVFQFSSLLYSVLIGFFFFAEPLDSMTLFGIFVVFFAGIYSSVRRIRSERKAKKLRS